MTTPSGPPGSERPNRGGQYPADQGYPSPSSGSVPAKEHQQEHQQAAPQQPWQQSYPPQDFGRPVHPQQDYPPAGYPQPGNVLPGYHPYGNPQNYPPAGYPQQSYPPLRYGQSAYSQQGLHAYPVHPTHRPQQIDQQPLSGGHDQPGYGGSGRSQRKSALPWILSGVCGIGMLVVILFLGFLAPGFFITTVFDHNAVQEGVFSILSEEYGQNVESVSCPPGQEVQVGSSFSCRATIDGEPREVTITVRTEAGEYEVARPS